MHSSENHVFSNNMRHTAFLLWRCDKDKPYLPILTFSLLAVSALFHARFQQREAERLRTLCWKAELPICSVQSWHGHQGHKD